jgi:pimeloyl-ACP methyl ester carboxylesterase
VLAAVGVARARDGRTALGPVYAFGHSLGGAAVLLAAARRPGVFSRIFVYEPVVFPPDSVERDGPPPIALAAERRRPWFASRADALANFSGKQPLDVLSPGSLEAYVDTGFAVDEDGSLTLRCPPAIEAALFRAGWACTAFGQLGGIQCPVYVASGDGTEGPARAAGAVVEELPDGYRWPMPGLGHFGPMQDPPRVAADVVVTLIG